MEAYDAYQMCLALKRHFTLGSTYDFIKYNGKTNASKTSFDTRKDKYSFHKLSKKDHPLHFMIANIIEYGPSVWIGDMVTDSKYEETYTKWLKRRESISYIFKSDLENLDGDFESNFVIADGQYPKLLQLYMKKRICIETLIILNDILKFIPQWNKQIEDTIMWPDIYNTCIKYRPFMEYDKAKLKKIALQTLYV